ncbi:hypothetical protein CEXT_31931 [Caerostris extrusa]|uniref:Uncharacterized protein n=1 Tax=Caerostris extrusa TaxID=172846 RepID=A0AAV4S128_CAEEX|nr:hypothetical protein CEXT_31931 [Caerostris extrusa]
MSVLALRFSSLQNLRERKNKPKSRLVANNLLEKDTRDTFVRQLNCLRIYGGMRAGPILESLLLKRGTYFVFDPEMGKAFKMIYNSLLSCCTCVPQLFGDLMTNCLVLCPLVSHTLGSNPGGA